MRVLPLLSLLPLITGACTRMADHVDHKDPGSTAPEYDPDVWEIGAAVACEAPTADFDRLEEQGQDRGIGLVNDPLIAPKHCPGVDGGVVASDLDDDGDIDLLFHAPDAFPHIYKNSGAGQFKQVKNLPTGTLPDQRRVTAAAAHDLNGDRLPELFLVGDGFLAISENLGSMDFGSPEILYMDEGYPYACFNTVALGDIDADNDLDVFLPALDAVLDEEFFAESMDPTQGTEDLLFLQEDDGFADPIAMVPWDKTNLSMFAIFTDRDADGDKDLLVGTDRPNSDIPPMAFYRNDGMRAGEPILVNDADAVKANLNLSAMGVGSADLNGDGLFDYCLTDLYARIRCLVSDGTGGYYDGGAALGLTPDLNSHPEWEPTIHKASQWTTWSAELQDLNNDGYRDLAVTAGPPADGSRQYDPTFTDIQPDVLFRGKADGTFEEDNGTAGFNDAAAHYGMAAADLDRDGALDLVVGTWKGSPLIWSNPCTEGAWLTIEPLGPPGNAEGMGIRVEVSFDGREDIQELHGARSVGQSPSELHFGLGTANTAERIRVVWPDGITQEFLNAPTRRILYVRHPEAFDTPLPTGARLD